MESICIQYHIKGIGKVVVRTVKAKNVQEAMSEVMNDLEYEEYILFNGGEGSNAIYGIATDSVAYFEVMSAEEYKAKKHEEELERIFRSVK